METKTLILIIFIAIIFAAVSYIIYTVNKHTKMTNSEAYQQGFAEFSKPNSSLQNPYRWNTKEFDWYIDGYTDAYNADKG